MKLYRKWKQFPSQKIVEKKLAIFEELERHVFKKGNHYPASNLSNNLLPLKMIHIP